MDTVEKNTVHALKHGRALCGFGHNPGADDAWPPPRDWPPAHRWIAWCAQNASKHINCAECKRRLTFGSVA